MEDISQIYKSKIFSSCWLNGVLISVILGMQILMENSVALRLSVHQDVTSIFTSTGQIVLLKVEIIGKMHIGTMHWSGISIARVSLHYSQLHKPHGCGRYSHGTFLWSLRKFFPRACLQLVHKIINNWNVFAHSELRSTGLLQLLQEIDPHVSVLKSR